MNKPVAILFVQKQTAITNNIANYINKNITVISQHVVLKRVYVNTTNAAQLKVTKTPCLRIGNKNIIGIEEIMNALTPPKKNVESYGIGALSPDEQILQYQFNIMNSEDSEVSESELRADEIRQKSEAFQKRRPAMDGCEKGPFIRGGRKIINNKTTPTSFDNDEDFYKASRKDNIVFTPTAKYEDNLDGDSILEDYYNIEADKSGRKPNTKPIRRSR